ncbi:MAG: hypothetical protein NC336_03335, partial [Clostridium sp.]|nr:hypothetical protein [Clostridium sp.]
MDFLELLLCLFPKDCARQGLPKNSDRDSNQQTPISRISPATVTPGVRSGKGANSTASRPRRVTKDGKLHTYYRDYQGNIRVVACDSVIEQVTHYYPYGLPWAQLTYREQNIRKYSGKELYTFFEVNAYNFEARLYDPASVRFGSMDKKSEDMY